ncbi:MAG TPA: acyl-CoA dehydrogenase family protein, partial [Polyangia bacterium]|nr:acyl-CoA dehydrogenase family protein [Polyangia bacterium]
TSEILSRKTIAARAVVEAATKALEAVGGGGYYRGNALERLVRDALAGQFHPFPAQKQQVFSGRIALGLEPPGEDYETDR